MQIVPLNSTASQAVSVQLAGQDCVISVYQKAFGLFFDLRLGGALIVAGVLCLNLTLIVRSIYLGFAGDLVFIDNQGSNDPDYTGLGTRFSLAYLEVADVAAIPNLSAGEG